MARLRHGQPVDDHDASTSTRSSRTSRFQVTDGLSDVSNPVFDKSGKYLFFFALDRRRPGQGLVRAVERRHARDVGRSTSPSCRTTWRRRSRGRATRRSRPTAEQEGRDEAGGRSKPRREARGADAGGEAAAKKDAPFRIDFEGLEYRILDLPIAAGGSVEPAGRRRGSVYYLKTVDGKTSLQPLRPDHAEERDAPARGDRLRRLGRRQEAALSQRQHLVDRADHARDSSRRKGASPWTRIEVRIDPRAEWKQIFDEAWRINRDYFYAPNMHGVDWEQRAREVRGVPARRRDARRPQPRHAVDVERAVGRPSPRRRRRHARRAEDGARRPARRRLRDRERPLPLQEGLRRPELEPAAARAADRAGRQRQGRRVPARGQRHAICGRRPTSTASSRTPPGKIVEITLGPNADGTGSRTVQVVPIANEAALRNRDWVEGNLRKVDKATGGRVAYVYVPNTGGAGLHVLQALLLPAGRTRTRSSSTSASTAAASVADYYIDILRRPFIANWAMRYGADLKTPFASIQGPKAMIIDETAGSGGDLLPWMFRKYKMGPLVGQRTWGGLVGILGFPVLMDGGTHHRAEPGDLDAGGRLGGRERRRAAGHRGRADAGRRDRRPRSAAREGDRSGDGGAEEEPAGQARAPGLSRRAARRSGEPSPTAGGKTRKWDRWARRDRVTSSATGLKTRPPRDTCRVLLCPFCLLPCHAGALIASSPRHCHSPACPSGGEVRHCSTGLPGRSSVPKTTHLFRRIAIGSAAAVLSATVLVRAQAPAVKAPAAGSPPVDFARDIQPIFKQYCAECHGPPKRGPLRLHTPERIRKGGQSGPAILARQERRQPADPPRARPRRRRPDAARRRPAAGGDDRAAARVDRSGCADARRAARPATAATRGCDPSTGRM